MHAQATVPAFSRTGQDPRYKWKLLGLLFFIASLNYADRTAVASVFPLLRRDLGLTDVQLAAVGSFFLWSYAACSPFAGYLGDRVSRSRTIAYSLVLWSAVMALTGFARNANELLATRILLGVAECAYLPAALGLVADYHGSATRGTAVALHGIGLAFGPVLGASLAGYIGDVMGWRWSCYTLGGAGLLFGIVAFFYLRDAEVVHAEQKNVPRLSMWRNLRDVVSVPSYWILVVEGMLLSVGIWMFLNWLPLYFRETFTMGLAAAGFSATALPQMTTTIGAMVGGFLADRFARRGQHRRMLLQLIFYFCAAPFLVVFLTKPSYGVIIAAIGMFYLFRSLGSCNEMPILCELLPSHKRSTAMGLFNTTQTIAGGFGIMIAGFLKQNWGLAGIFSGVSVLVVLAGLVVTFGYLVFLKRDLARAEAAE